MAAVQIINRWLRAEARGNLNHRVFSPAFGAFIMLHAWQYGRARWALQMQHLDLPSTDEPFAAIIRCTSDPGNVDKRTRSKWSRVLRYAAEHKTSAEPLAAFVQRKGGINECAGRFTRCLGRGGRS